MHLIFCIDEKDGLQFCGRRLSRDSKLNEHMLGLASGTELWMSPYSGKLFSGESVRIAPDYQTKAREGDYCFFEELPAKEVYNRCESIILYHWNRSYPATVRFPRELLKGMHLAETEEFSGSSHEKITMERYTL